MKNVILVCGVQGSGKSWVCRQLSDKFCYVPHDRCWSHPDAEPDMQSLDPAWGPKGSVSTHVPEIIIAAHSGSKAVLTEVPFGETRLRDALIESGLKVTPVFVVTDTWTLQQRYLTRERRPIPQDALMRAGKMRQKARDWGAFAGSSDQVLEFLKRWPGKYLPVTPKYTR